MYQFFPRHKPTHYDGHKIHILSRTPDAPNSVSGSIIDVG